MRVRARGILVLVWVVGILVALFAWTCNAQAGGGSGDTKQQTVLEEPEQHTEQSTEDEDDAHDDHESHFSLLHFETQKMFASIVGSCLMLGGAIFGGVCALRAARRRKHQQE